MHTTIDQAGRVVIPASVRKQAGLKAGTALQVILEGPDIRLVRAGQGAKLERVGNRLVARPTTDRRKLPAVDLAKLIEEERDRWPR
jgi:AbrB family looped-hinge helix DNA binding protein